MPPYAPTKEIKNKYPQVDSKSRTIDAKSHSWIGYLVTDNGFLENSDCLIPIRTKGYIYEMNFLEELKEVKKKNWKIWLMK